MKLILLHNFYLSLPSLEHKNLLAAAYIVVLFILVLLYLFNQLKVSKISASKLKSEILEQSPVDYRNYFLYLALVFPLLEFFYTLFDIQNTLQLYSGYTLGLVCFALFALTGLNAFKEKSYDYFMVCFFILWSIICYNIFLDHSLLMVYSKYFLIVFSSFFLFKRYAYYVGFILINFLILTALVFITPNNSTNLLVLANGIFVTAIIHAIQFIKNIKNTETLLFTKSIVNNTNAIIIAFTKLGTIKYCNDAVTKILGYSTEEVLGGGFQKMTENDLITQTKGKTNGLIVTKLKCKNGDYKQIQWTNYQLSSNLYVATGQDVTTSLLLEKKYTNLIQNAKDIIYECDKTGVITYANTFTTAVLGYDLDEIIGKNYLHFTREDYKTLVYSFYTNNELELDEYDLFEFPIVNKNGDSIWISQKVSIIKDEKQEIVGYNCIMRDINFSKSIEIEKNKRQQEIARLNNVSNHLSTLNFQNFESLKALFEYICSETAAGLNIDRVSIWDYKEDKIILENLFVSHKNEHFAGLTLTQENHEDYFMVLNKEPLVIASDVYQNPSLKGFATAYFPENYITSLLDVPIYTSGKLRAILCLEATKEIKYWSTDDINFAKTVGDIIALTIEVNKRKLAENQILYKNEIHKT